MMRKIFLFALCLCCSSVSAGELYTFKSNNLDPDFWYGGRVAENLFEFNREVSGNRLRLSASAYGNTSTAVGRRYSNNRVYLKSEFAGNLKQVQTVLSIDRAQVRNCQQSPKMSLARIQLIAYWFNNGSSSFEGDRTGDIGSIIELRAAAGTNRVKAYALPFRCNSPGCSQFDSLIPGVSLSDRTDKNWISLGTQEIGKNVKLIVDYDRNTNALFFSSVINGKRRSKPFYFDGTNSFQRMPVRFVLYSARVNMGNCATGPRSYSSIDSSIVNLKVEHY